MWQGADFREEVENENVYVVIGFLLKLYLLYK